MVENFPRISAEDFIRTYPKDKLKQREVYFSDKSETGSTHISVVYEILPILDLKCNSCDQKGILLIDHQNSNFVHHVTITCHDHLSEYAYLFTENSRGE